MLNQFFILFLSFGITDAIDILLVAIMLYQLYKMVKGTAAVNVFIGLALIYVVWIIVRAFELKLLGSIPGAVCACNWVENRKWKMENSKTILLVLGMLNIIF